MTPDMVNVMRRINEIQKRFGLSKPVKQEGTDFKQLVDQQKNIVQTPIIEKSTAPVNNDQLLLNSLFKQDDSSTESTAGLSSLLKQKNIIIKDAMELYKKNQTTKTPVSKNKNSEIDIYAD